jgi:hypothetical protein
MAANYDNFTKWFKEPLRCLYKNKDAGFAILMISLPILERYLRQSSGVYENSLDARFYDALVKMFPSLKNTAVAKKFWEVYRHGLLHQATLKAGDTVLSAAVHDSAPEIEFDHNVFTVSPTKFSQRVVATIDSDFPTYEGTGSPKHAPARISARTGRSGWNPDVK